MIEKASIQQLQSEDIQQVEICESLSDPVTKRNDLRWPFNLLSEDISLDPPRKPHSQFIVNELLGRHREHLCNICQYMVM